MNCSISSADIRRTPSSGAGMTDRVDFLLFLKDTGRAIKNRLLASTFIKRLPDGPIKDRILDYSRRGGKYIRPGLTCAAAGAVGGRPEDALAVGAAIEMFHTWTLVHDDIIDRDDSRRGGPTIHARIMEDFKYWDPERTAISREHLAHSLALLIGDAQHGLVMDLLIQPALDGTLPADLVLNLILKLEGDVLPALLTGEVSDVLQAGMSLEDITYEEIETMLARKTGALLTFSLVAGGMIGLRTTSTDHPMLKALSLFGEKLGIAFQLRDDLLGIMGDENKLGKPIGSDFREGKRTLAVKYAFDHADKDGKTMLKKLIGKPDLTEKEVRYLKQKLVEWGGISYVETYAEKLISDALKALDTLPDNKYRSILAAVARYTVKRQY